MSLRLTIGLMTCVLLGLGCATDPAGRTTITRPECQCSAGGKSPLPMHGRYGGAGIPVPGTGR